MEYYQFLVTLVSLVCLHYYGNVDPNLKPIDVDQTQLRDSYDFIIIGAGSAGCPLANRLSEIDGWNVLLIEAGGDEDPITDTPGLATRLVGTVYDWNYTTTRQKRSCGALNFVCRYPRGFAMGGSSTTNYMMYIRGNEADYNEWASLGNEGWSFDDVLPYYKKLENVSYQRSFPSKRDAELRGFNGPVFIQDSMFTLSFKEDLIRAGLEMGYEQGDFNGYNQSRIDYIQNTIDGRSRQSTSKAYLNPIRNRPNLHVIKSSFVTKINIDEKTAVSVEYLRNGKFYTVKTSKEIILSAGAVNTPQILMLSGIGPREDLEHLGIPVVKDLQVGRNLQDHVLLELVIDLDKDVELGEDNLISEESAKTYALYGQGPLTTTYVQTVAFKGFLGETIPNGQWFTRIIPGPGNNQQISVLAGVMKPVSRGFVRLRSGSPYDDPLINPGLLDDDADYALMKEVAREVFKFLDTPTMKKMNPRINEQKASLCIDQLNETNSLIDCLIWNYSTVYFHPVGSAKMGPPTDPDSVVNDRLEIYGVRNLRVVDASIMPTIPRGNTNAPAIMIGEKGADLIKEKYGGLPIGR